MSARTVSILLGPDCDLEAIALRGTLEYLGFVVALRPIGRPWDLINVLKGDKQTKISDILVFCFHGKRGRLVVPKLAPDIYEVDEPRSDFSAQDIARYAAFDGQDIIATGCTLGHRAMASSFLQANARTFIGPIKYPDGNAVLFFATALFYYLSRGEDYFAAFEKAKNADSNAQQFKLYDRQSLRR